MGKPGRESSMRKMHASIHAAPVRAAPVRGCEVRASAHAAPARAAEVRASEVRASAHAAEMHSAATEVPTAEAAAMAATASERRGRKSKRRSKRTRDEATKELVVHPNSSVVEFAATDTVARRRRPGEPKDPTITSDKCDSF